jgi:hypothetical protein
MESHVDLTITLCWCATVQRNKLLGMHCCTSMGTIEQGVVAMSVYAVCGHRCW